MDIVKELLGKDWIVNATDESNNPIQIKYVIYKVLHVQNLNGVVISLKGDDDSVIFMTYAAASKALAENLPLCNAGCVHCGSVRQS